MERRAGKKDRMLAQVCVHCPVCTRARKKQRGAALWLVKNVEDGLCPFCRAYERVYGRKAHEPEPQGPRAELQQTSQPSGGFEE